MAGSAVLSSPILAGGVTSQAAPTPASTSSRRESSHFTQDRPEDESDKKEDISSNSGERKEIEPENNIGRITEKRERLKNEDKDTDEIDAEGCS